VVLLPIADIGASWERVVSTAGLRL